MNLRLLALASVLASASSLPLCAQGLPTPGWKKAKERILWNPNLPAPNDTPSFADLAILNLWVDGEPDMVFLSNGEPILGAYADTLELVTDLQDANGPILTGVTSLCAFRDPALNRPAVLCADASGLTVLNLHWGASATPVTTPDTTAWADAQLLEQHVFDGDSYAFGLTSDGLSILTIASDPSTSTVVLGPSWTSSSAILDFSVVDWDQDGDDDLAYVTATDLVVVDAAGSLPPLFTTRLTGESRLATVRDDGAGVDTLVFLTEAPSGNWLLLPLNSSSTSPTPLLLEVLTAPEDTSPTPIDVLEVAASDLTGDGRQDLVLTTSTARLATVLVNQSNSTSGGLASFGLATLMTDHWMLRLDPNDTSQAADSARLVPVVFDLEGDGSKDIAIASNDRDRVFVFDMLEYVPASPEHLALALSTGPGLLPGSLNTATTYRRDETAGDPPALILAFSDIPLPVRTAYTHIQVRLFEQKTAGAGIGINPNEHYAFEMESASGHNSATGLSETPSEDQYCVVESTFFNAETAAGLQDDIPWPDQNLFAVQFRYVTLDINGNVEDVSQGFHGGFAMQYSTSLNGQSASELDLEIHYDDLFDYSTPGSQYFTPSHTLNFGSAPSAGQALTTYSGIYISDVFPPPSGGPEILPAIPKPVVDFAYVWNSN